MRLSSLLGTSTWYACVGDIDITGTEEIWGNPNATLEELMELIRDVEPQQKFEYLSLREWKKIGREIKNVEVKRIDLP